MKLAHHCWTSMNSDLPTDIATAAHAGFKALEIGATKVDQFLKDHTIHDLRDLLNRHNIQPATINAVDFIAFRGDEFAQVQDRCRQLCQWSQVIGCPTVIVVPSPTPEGPIVWPEAKVPWPKVVEEHVAALRQLADMAKPMGVKLAVEFLGFDWSSVRTPRGTYEIVMQAERDNVGMIIDCMHVYLGGGLLSELDVIDPQRILSLHLDDMEDVPKEDITDTKRLLPGMGVIPLDDICRRLAAIGYDGFCSIELFRPEYHAWDPDVIAAKARDCALKVLKPYFDVD